MISPDMRQSFLLSSSTVFMFSIQMASTGPSNKSHLRSGVVSTEHLRKVVARTWTQGRKGGLANRACQHHEDEMKSSGKHSSIARVRSLFRIEYEYEYIYTYTYASPQPLTPSVHSCDTGSNCP